MMKNMDMRWVVFLVDDSNYLLIGDLKTVKYSKRRYSIIEQFIEICLHFYRPCTSLFTELKLATMIIGRILLAIHMAFVYTLCNTSS